MRALCLIAALAAAACGASPPAPAVPEVALVEGEAVYTLRHNPPVCLGDEPRLHAEVLTPAGWERVSLENADDDEDLVAPLLAALQATPDAEKRVRGNLVADTRSYGDDHAARVLRVLELEPAAEEAP